MSSSPARRAALAGLVAACLLGAWPASAAQPPRPQPEPPSPVSGPVTHPGADGTHADRGPRGRDLGRAAEGHPRGLDVSAYQSEVDWGNARGQGAEFAYVKATEGTTYRSPVYRAQYDGAAAVGMVRGAYHFALPDRATPEEQARFLVDNGGGGIADGRTLPLMLDIEYNPYGATCYGLSAAEMSDWIRRFSDTVKARSGRAPTIYTSRGFWQECTDDSPAFGENPLFIARYDDEPGAMPASWRVPAFWQFDEEGPLPGDQDVFLGTPQQLRALAGTPPASAAVATPPSSTTPTPAPATPAPTTVGKPSAAPTTVPAPASPAQPKPADARPTPTPTPDRPPRG